MLAPLVAYSYRGTAIDAEFVTLRRCYRTLSFLQERACYGHQAPSDHERDAPKEHKRQFQNVERPSHRENQNAADEQLGAHGSRFYANVFIVD
jgi:hypothetical protein